MSTQVAVSAPAAAPSVLSPYSAPIIGAAVSILSVRARASNGSDAPMKNVGHSRLPKSTSGIASRAIDAPSRWYRKS